MEQVTPFELRKHVRMRSSELAAAVGVAKSTIARYETARIHIPAQRLHAMAAAMCIDQDYFYMRPGSPLPKLRSKQTTMRSEPASCWRKMKGERHEGHGLLLVRSWERNGHSGARRECIAFDPNLKTLALFAHCR